MEGIRKIRGTLLWFVPVLALQFSLPIFQQFRVSSYQFHPNGQYKSASKKAAPLKRGIRPYQEEEDDGIDSVWVPDSTEYDPEDRVSLSLFRTLISQTELDSGETGTSYLLSPLLLNLPPPRFA